MQAFDRIRFNARYISLYTTPYLHSNRGGDLNPMQLFTIFERIPKQPEDLTNNTGRISVGDRITLFDYQEHQAFELTLVSPQNGKPEKGVISILSPLGSELLGARPGHKISIPVFGRVMHYMVVYVKQTNSQEVTN